MQRLIKGILTVQNC